MLKTYGLVLAGGGAKGAYQMGAWKAMKEMRIRFNAIVGVSIGAINGALIASNDYKDALTLWSSVTLEQGVKMDGELKNPNNLFSAQNYATLLREFFKNGGIDASPTKQLLAEYIEEDKVRTSNIPLGLVTYRLSSMNPLELFIEDIPSGCLIDYLLASAKFPGMSNIGPDNEWYLDGGVYDNAPVSLIRKRGINRLIVVDISSIKGAAHRDDFSCTETIYIRPYNINDLGASFDFSEEMIEKRMLMGYLDAKKAFGKLGGNIYYFTPGTFKAMLSRYGYKTVEQLEKLAYKIGFDRLRVYSEKDFLHELKVCYLIWEEEERKKEENKEGYIDRLRKRISSIRRNKEDFELAMKVLGLKTDE